MRSCGLMQKLIKFNLAHEDTMMRLQEFLFKGIDLFISNFDKTINVLKKKKNDKHHILQMFQVSLFISFHC